MSRTMFGALAPGCAVVGMCPVANPPSAKRPAVPLEFAVPDGDRLWRIELYTEVDGVPLSALWDDTFTKLFAYFDRDASGALDAKEAAFVPTARALRQALGSGFTPPSGAAPGFAELDRNGDGDVSRREFTGPAAVFDKLDADGDGRLDAREAGIPTRWPTGPRPRSSFRDPLERSGGSGAPGRTGSGGLSRSRMRSPARPKPYNSPSPMYYELANAVVPANRPGCAVGLLEASRLVRGACAK